MAVQRGEPEANTSQTESDNKPGVGLPVAQSDGPKTASAFYDGLSPCPNRTSPALNDKLPPSALRSRGRRDVKQVIPERMSASLSDSVPRDDDASPAVG